MKSKLLDSFPPRLLKQLKEIGINIKAARKKRKFTMNDMALRCKVSVDTISRVEKGDPTVAFGIVAQVLSILGLSKDLDLIAAPETDELGSLLAEQALPERVRRISNRTKPRG
ncbi:MAG: helix-turn-helix domain-containing protein [Methylophagaceae bacterium]